MSERRYQRTGCVSCGESCRVEPTYVQVLQRWRNWPRFQTYKLHICPPCKVGFMQVIEAGTKVGEPVSVD